MIQSNKGCIEVRGDMPLILVELEDIIQAIYESFTPKMGKDNAKKIIATAFCNGLMNKQDRNRDAQSEFEQAVCSKEGMKFFNDYIKHLSDNDPERAAALSKKAEEAWKKNGYVQEL